MLENIFFNFTCEGAIIYSPPLFFKRVCTFKIADAQMKNGTQQPNYLLFVCCSQSKKVVLKGRM